MFNHSYDELYRAADILWPGEAENILANPTDEQLALILAILPSPPVKDFGSGWAALSGQPTCN